MNISDLVGELIKHLCLLTTLLTLAVYPTAVLLGFSFNPIEVRWGSHLARRGRPFSGSMPPALRNRADAVSRYLNFVVDALILGFIAGLSRRISVSPARIGLQFINWERDAIVGITAGAAAVAIMGLMLRKVPIDPLHDFTHRVRRGSALLWILILMSAAFSEELWIAFCLVVFRAAAYSVIVSVATTIVVFAAMHYSYGFWGAVAVATKGTVSAVLFLHFGSLVVTFSYHFVSNLGSLYWNRYWRR